MNNKTSRTKQRKALSSEGRRYCSMPVMPERELPPNLPPGRVRLIRDKEKKWVDGTVLHYCFFTSPSSWKGTPAELDVVRQGFDSWKALDIGLEFREVESPDEAEIRIGFLRGDGAWSYIGRDALEIGQSDRTMNFGWNIRIDPDTALHEIGHALGFPHEHQNPFSGIVWDEDAVYAALAKPPNNWSRQTTWWNIIRKIEPDDVQGSRWDPDSIMHYPFEAGLIVEPQRFETEGLSPAPGLSALDREWVRSLYPPLSPVQDPTLEPFQSVQLRLMPGEQANFHVKPEATRNYNFRTLGTADTVLVLFEYVNGELRYVTGDDDSGEDYNAEFRVKLFAGRDYVLRARLYWVGRQGDFGVIMW
jgi:hypothetical protein